MSSSLPPSRSRSRSSEYVDDVPYVRHYLADLSPSRLRLVAALNGIAPPPEGEFDYCELGCAHGDTLAALAAANPDGRFLGIDLGPAHIASAKRLARDGALENIGFLERDFGDLLEEDIGEFDFVVAYGVVSWVSPEKRAQLLAFASKKLKPGGLLYISYNAMPGWSAVEPLRQLLLFPSMGTEMPNLERARHGLAFAQSMQRAGSEYFTKNPHAAEMLETMAKAGLPYIVHEYMHEHWVPMYFARVAAEMAAHDLHFVGSLPVLQNFRRTAISEESERLFESVTDRLTYESLKDFAVDTFFRRDLFVKGRPARSPDVTTGFLDGARWGTLADAPPEERTIRLPHRTISIAGAMFDGLLSAIAARASTLPELEARKELHGIDRDELRRGIVELLIADLVVPARTPRRHVNGGAAFSVPSVYNQMMLRRVSSEMPLLMTSTVTGTAFTISTLEALALRVFTEVAAAERDAWVERFVGQNVLRLRIGDRVLEEPAEQRRAILDTVAQLQSVRLAKLVELGILAPV